MNTQLNSVNPNTKQPPTSTQVCVIGNSYSGAVKKAYQSGEINTEPYKLFFFASAGADFKNVRIVDGAIANVEFFDDASHSIDHYGAVVIYGDLPLPGQVLAFFKRVPVDKYSVAVRKARLLHWLQQFITYQLVSALAARRIPKIFVLSRNYPVREPAGAHLERSDGVDLIREMIRPAFYIPAPELLFSDEGIPREDFYTGSLNVAGEPAKQPVHHLNHLNLAGGKIMLTAIIDRLRAE